MALSDITLRKIEASKPADGEVGMITVQVRGFKVNVSGSRYRGYSARVFAKTESGGFIDTDTVLLCATIGEVKSDLLKKIREMALSGKYHV